MKLVVNVSYHHTLAQVQLIAKVNEQVVTVSRSIKSPGSWNKGREDREERDGNGQHC